jgi:hypothetical protein
LIFFGESKHSFINQPHTREKTMPDVEPENPVAVSHLAVALAKAQMEFPAISLDKSVSYQNINFQYASLGNMIHHTRPILAKNGLAVLQLPSMQKDYVKVETLLMHGSGEQLRSEIETRCIKADDIKAVGALISYLRRYAYGSMLGIALDGDYDAEVISETYTGDPTQKRWLFDFLTAQGIHKDMMAKVSLEMMNKNYELNEASAMKAVGVVGR